MFITGRRRRLGEAMLRHLPALRRYAMGLTGNAAAADDLVQDCIERALRQLDTLRDEITLAAWLRRILFNAFVDDRRRSRSHDDPYNTEVLETIVDTGATPDVQEEVVQTLRAISGLLPQHRQVLLLISVEGLSYREAAEEIGVPLGTVMSRLARARDALRQALSGPQTEGVHK